MNLSDGSILRGCDAMIDDARARVSQVKLILKSVINDPNPEAPIRIFRGELNEALTLLNELDDRG